MFEQYGKRVEVLEEKQGVFGFGPIYKVTIKYSNGDIFFIGWVDSQFMPILFGRAREEKLISDDIAYPIKNFIKREGTQNIDFRLAALSDKDEILDLRFQSFFEGGANCISALMGFKQEFDDAHLTVIACIENKIIGLIYGYNRMESLNIKTDYYIEYIYVHKNFRGRNIGSYLLKNMENIITKMGYKKIVTYSQGYEDHVDIVYSFNLKNGFRDTVDGASELGYDFITIYMEKDL